MAKTSAHHGSATNNVPFWHLPSPPLDNPSFSNLQVRQIPRPEHQILATPPQRKDHLHRLEIAPQFPQPHDSGPPNPPRHRVARHQTQDDRTGVPVGRVVVVFGAHGVIHTLMRYEGIDDGLVAALNDGTAGDGEAVVVEDHLEVVAVLGAADHDEVG